MKNGKGKHQYADGTAPVGPVCGASAHHHGCPSFLDGASEEESQSECEYEGRDVLSSLSHVVSGVVVPTFFAVELSQLLTQVMDFSLDPSGRQGAVLALLLLQ